MGGRSYYCDYCDCFIKNDKNVREKHNIGLQHKIAKANYLVNYKDPQEIITEEEKKIPCLRFSTNKQCQFGLYCRYSHYSKEELASLKWIAYKTTLNKEMVKIGASAKFPWKYPSNRKQFHHRTPSLQSIDFNKVNDTCFQEWG